ncbi:MAG: GH3 auxin-responsive promoter family protein [Brumimicrobium sp.]|nr:GH3 auxin-responsive promoter family protein [Brumimicrobium sp.]
MALVGTFLKGTTRVGYNYGVKKKIVNPLQSRVLYNLLNKAKKTQFGKDHDFASILQQIDICDAYRKKVPLFTYEDFFDPYIKKQLEGEKNMAWPNKINHFALSSGTTNDSSKRIPVSDQMIRQFQRTTLEQVLRLHELNLPNEFFQAVVLTIGGSTKLTEEKHYFEGDLSGILQKNKSFIYKLFSKPGNKIAQIKDWNEKLDQIVKHAPKWDVGVIAGAPSWILMLLERIIEKYELKNIHEIWPNFRLLLHGGVFLDTYKGKIEALCSKQVYFINTYLASEGYFAFQKNHSDEGMTLLTKHGVYYEFLEEKYFNHINEGKSLRNLPTLLLNEIEENKNYALIISTSSGLWRYFMGDVIKFCDFPKRQFHITGRVKHTLNIAGEHLSVENMNRAVLETSNKLGLSSNEFCVVPNELKNGHNWYVGTDKPADAQEFADELDRCLEALNDDYVYVRKYHLKKPSVRVLPIQLFYDFMEEKGKLGGQHKFPRVLNKTQLADWEDFLRRRV